MSGHTKSGWCAELDSTDQLRHIWRTDEDGELELVAVVMGDSSDDYDPVPAERARLIAAAPDLLEALRQLLGNAELARFHLSATEDGLLIGSALFDTIQQARDIISRATEAQP